jgi:superoxide dismutase, Cu-Zn family
MISRTIAIFAATMTLAVPVAAMADDHAAATEVRTVAAGHTLGLARLEATPTGVLVTVDVSGLPEGELGFHVHETGRCDPGQGFSTAGGHFEPHGKAHGFRHAGGPHAGDMPNLFVGSDGKARLQVLNRAVALDDGEAGLLDADGSSLVIHAGPDDYVSQPAGASGPRIACAVIAPPAQ